MRVVIPRISVFELDVVVVIWLDNDWGIEMIGLGAKVLWLTISFFAVDLFEVLVSLKYAVVADETGSQCFKIDHHQWI